MPRKLRERLDEAEETLRALRNGEVDAIVASGPHGDRVYTLKGADEAYRLMVQNMAEGALTVAPDGLILFANEKIASLLAIPHERVIGSSFHDFIVPEDAGTFSALLTHELGGSPKCEVRLKTARETYAVDRRPMPSRLANQTFRSLIPTVASRAAELVKASISQPPRNLGVEHVAQPVAQQVDRKHREPQEDAGEVAHLFGISRSRDGYFLERHPKLAPVETATAGVFLAGACQAPKDIPDSVAQAGGAAAAALALMDQGTIELDACVAEVIEARCAACGQCVQACPLSRLSLWRRASPQ